MYVYLNDRLVPVSDAKVSVFDHGFLYGDGVFETMRVYDGVVFMLNEHLYRLYRSASMIRLDISFDPDFIKKAIYETLYANKLRNAYVRVTVSRGYGSVGLDTELCKEPTFVVIAEEFKEYPESYYRGGVKVIVAKTRRNHKDALNPQIKSINFLNNILAKIEAKEKGAYEAIMLNSEGRVAEGTISNVFFVKEAGAIRESPLLCTPSKDAGILDGITRGIAINLAERDSIMVNEGSFTPEDLYSALEVFLTNTTMEIIPVCQVDNVRYSVGSVTKLLHEAYRKVVKDYVTSNKLSSLKGRR
ncbi:MAG: branched-chain-amino-acid transaminase [Nitrospirae bacterium]|nr:branched-chain-amino-acid transaminase [Nitrospirota bacterium]